MKVEFYKMFGIGGSLHWYEMNLLFNLSPGTIFQVSRHDRANATVGIVDIPITRNVLDNDRLYLLGNLCTLSDTAQGSLHLGETIQALRIEIPDSPLQYDIGNIDGSPYHWVDLESKSSLAVRVSEEAASDALEVLSLFYEAYRHSKYQVDSNRGRDLVQSIDQTRRMAAWDFLSFNCFRVSDETLTVSYWMPAHKSSGWTQEDLVALRHGVEDSLVSRPTLRQLSLYDAEQALYDGDYSMAVLHSVIAMEVALSEFAVARWKALGVPKTRIEKAQDRISLSPLVNIELISLAPPGSKPATTIVGALDHARILRNNIVHKGLRNVKRTQAGEAVEAVRNLLTYLKSLG